MKLTFYPSDSEPKTFSVAKHSLIIGRSPSCDIPLIIEGISRQHCRIEYKNGDLFLTDLGSTNGVFIDGRRIQPKTPIRYQTFLPLSIGAIPNVMIELPDISRYGTEQLLPGVEVVSPGDHPGTESLTRTKLVPRNFPKRNPRPPIPVRREEKSNFTNILALLILVGGVYYFFTNFKEQPKEQIPEPLKTKKNINDNGHF